MVEEVQSQEVPKKAFIEKPSSNQERIEKEEEELKELFSQQDEPEEQQEEDAEEAPKSAEEKTFKKRYGDLRRHTQKQTDELQIKIRKLESQLDTVTKEQIKLPKSEQEIEEWAREYPDVAGIIETIATKKAQEQAHGLEERLREIDEMQEGAERDKAEVQLMQIHPDFDSIRSDDEFHEWAEEQPKWIQDALYENDSDALAASRAIDLYKADKGIKKTTKKKNKDDAAFAVTEKSERNRLQSDETADYLKESQVQSMSTDDYETHKDDIMEAIRANKFIYDVSGSAR
ncbi:MAG: hypothetical protein QGH83_13810 [Candidatus Pacebacteria bacterium]|jgi:hypothetical protein|nr:hypothetical protein [Candidatus Paceibacterota bacterium]